MSLPYASDTAPEVGTAERDPNGACYAPIGGAQTPIMRKKSSVSAWQYAPKPNSALMQPIIDALEGVSGRDAQNAAINQALACVSQEQLIAMLKRAECVAPGEDPACISLADYTRRMFQAIFDNRRPWLEQKKNCARGCLSCASLPPVAAIL